MDQVIQVTTTVNDKAYAESIASKLIEQNLVACAQIAGPIESIYRWHGNIERQNEWFCFVKTTRELYPEVEAAILEIHPYDLPEIIAAPITAGSDAYLSWVSAAIQNADHKDEEK